MADDKENPYAKAPKGETAAAKKTRQAKFYHQQRINAEETGDQGTVNKIYGKLGKKSLVGARKGDTSLNVDEKTTDKAALGTVAALAGGGGALRAGARLAAGAAKKAVPAIAGAAQKALSSGSKQIPETSAMAKPAMRNVTGSARQALKPAQKALPKPKGESPKMQHAKVRAGSQRAAQSTSRNKGTNPRAVRSAKMDADKKAGKATAPKDMMATLKESVRQAKAKKKAS